MSTFLEYLPEILCIAFCFLHFVFGLVNALLTRKKIDKICDKCGTPLASGEEHKCLLSDSQIDKLYEFVLSLRNNENGGDKNG
ncbi:hypothetical protein [Dipodfec virus UOA04_Rod_754]|nr:hypothetical protein [Dipodfec virus UOA04_Rod_754]